MNNLESSSKRISMNRRMSLRAFSHVLPGLPFPVYMYIHLEQKQRPHGCLHGICLNHLGHILGMSLLEVFLIPPQMRALYFLFNVEKCLYEHHHFKLPFTISIFLSYNRFWINFSISAHNNTEYQISILTIFTCFWRWCL